MRLMMQIKIADTEHTRPAAKIKARALRSRYGEI
jgi:hypothetical protein